MSLGLEGHRSRLRERFANSGLDGFHDHEVLELMLAFAIPRRDVKPLAKALLEEFKSLAAVMDAPVAALQEISGIGPQAALLLNLMPQLLERYQKDRWRETRIISSTPEAVGYLATLLGHARNEIFCVLALTSANAVIALERIQEGTVNRTAVFPRLVVEAALKHRATAIILAHNHPGGDPRPSEADRQITRKLVKVLGSLDIAVHDHIIISGPAGYSFAEHGEMP